MIPRHRIIPTVLGALACLFILVVGLFVGTGGRMPSLSFGADKSPTVSSFTVVERGKVTTIDHKVYLKVAPKTVIRNGQPVTLPGQTIPVTSTGTVVRRVPVVFTVPGRTLTTTATATTTNTRTETTTVVRTIVSTVPTTVRIPTTVTQTVPTTVLVTVTQTETVTTTTPGSTTTVTITCPPGTGTC